VCQVKHGPTISFVSLEHLEHVRGSTLLILDKESTPGLIAVFDSENIWWCFSRAVWPDFRRDMDEAKSAVESCSSLPRTSKRQRQTYYGLIFVGLLRAPNPTYPCSLKDQPLF
jgi:hypothetical protein